MLDDPSVRRLAHGPDIAKRQRVVHPHVPLDESAEDPCLLAGVVAFEQEQLVELLGCPQAAAPSSTVGMRQADLHRRLQRLEVFRLGGTYPKGELVHAAASTARVFRPRWRIG